MRALLTACAVVAFCVGALGQESIDFGSVGVGSTATATYTLRNTGLFSCAVQAVGFGEEWAPASGPFRVVAEGLPYTVPSGGSAAWAVTFSPTAVGVFTDTMLIRLKCGLFSQTLSVPLLGSGRVGSASPSDVFGPPSDVTATCPCAAEIFALRSELGSRLASIDANAGTNLAQALQSLDQAFELLDACVSPEGADTTCRGPFPSEGGQKFQRFMNAYRDLILTAAGDLPSIAPEEPVLAALLADGARVVAAVAPELQEIALLVASLPSDQQTCVDTYVAAEGVEFLTTCTTVVADSAIHPKLRATVAEQGTDVGGTLLRKALIWLKKLPGIGDMIDGLDQDARELQGAATDALGVASLLFQYELERKLDGIIAGLFGIVIPANATESQLADLLRRIPTDSVAGRLGRLEGKLDTVGDGVNRLSGEIAGIGDRLRGIEQGVAENQRELADLEKKLCCVALAMKSYAGEMGEALYGERQAFEFRIPDLCGSLTLAQCDTMSTSPAGVAALRKPIKPEIEGLESDMAWVKETLLDIQRRLGGGLPTIDETPPITPPTTEEGEGETTVEYEWLAITKKIYIYAEDTFEARSAADVREIRVETPAFDVSGWIDLWELRPGDTVTIELRIDVDGHDRLFRSTSFDGATDARLVYFDELTGGRPFIVGNRVTVRIAQTASADGYGTPVGVAYQFIVQSQQ